MITKKYYKLIRVSYEDLNYLTLTNTSGEDGLFSITKQGNPNFTNLQYSTNGVDWTTYDLTTSPTVSVGAGEHLYLRGNNANGFNYDTSNYCYFGMNVDHNISGNLFSLRNADPAVFSTYTSTLEREFTHLFQNDTHLIDASGLTTSKITSAGNASFQQTFLGCSSLTTSPDFSSTTSVSFQSFSGIFQNCANLSSVTAPDVSSWDGGAFSYWLYQTGTSATGTKTVYAPTGLEIPTNSVSGIPTGWTRVDY